MGLCGVLSSGLVQNYSQHSCVVASSVFSIRSVSLHVVHPYSSIDTTAAKKKLRFILSVRSDFHMTDNLSIAVHSCASHVSMSFFSVFCFFVGPKREKSKYFRMNRPTKRCILKNHLFYFYPCFKRFIAIIRQSLVTSNVAVDFATI